MPCSPRFQELRGFFFTMTANVMNQQIGFRQGPFKWATGHRAFEHPILFLLVLGLFMKVECAGVQELLRTM
jgi:hypothetical protein